MNPHAPDTGNNLADQAPGLPPGEDRPVPLAVGNFEEPNAFDPLSGDGESGRKMDMGTLLIIAVIVIAVAGLLSMRTLAKVAGSATTPAEDDPIEAFLPHVNRVMTTNEMVLSVLNEEYSERQIPLAAVQRNPFILFESMVSRKTDDGPVDPVGPDPWDQDRERREEQMMSAGERFRLKSVLMGSVPLANLNDKIVRVGESFMIEPEHVEFRVATIDVGSVTLVADEPALNLIHEVIIELERRE